MDHGQTAADNKIHSVRKIDPSRPRRARYRSLAMDTEGAQLPVLEFWPDYGPGPLWLGNGKAADLDSLGLSIDLVARLRAYNAAYGEDRLPSDGRGDPYYLEEGKNLLAEAREALAGRYRVVVTEPWWGEAPSDYEK